MIGRFATVSFLVLVLVGCAPRLNVPFVTFAQEKAPAPANAPEGAAATAAAPPPGIETTPDANAYRLGPEDVIDFYVHNDRELNRDRVPVRPDGKVSLPLVHDIQAAGLTVDELRAQLIQRLSAFFERPEVAVTVREVHSFKVSVQGNVRMPGQYEIRSEQTVLDLISRAQGFNEFADKGDIRVIRRTNGNERSIKFNYGDAIDAKPGANFTVERGDVIIVD
jgi:polysaccharide export outer membrane protein